MYAQLSISENGHISSRGLHLLPLVKTSSEVSCETAQKPRLVGALAAR